MPCKSSSCQQEGSPHADSIPACTVCHLEYRENLDHDQQSLVNKQTHENTHMELYGKVKNCLSCICSLANVDWPVWKEEKEVILLLFVSENFMRPTVNTDAESFKLRNLYHNICTRLLPFRTGKFGARWWGRQLYAKSDNGSPRVDSSQSRTAITSGFFSSKIKLSNLQQCKITSWIITRTTSYEEKGIGEKKYMLRRKTNKRQKQRHDKVLITLYQPKISMNNGCRIICWNIL